MSDHLTMSQPTDSANGHLSETQGRLPGVASAHLDTPELAALIEALLLVAPEPPTLKDIAAVTTAEIERIEDALSWLATQPRGSIVQRHGNELRLVTAPRFAPQIRLFLGMDREARLSSAALETLAIVAYQQPVTRAEIEAVRGVDTSGVLATLHARSLIEPVSRLSALGNPIQYGTTPEFLRHFGLSSLADLPPLGTIGGNDARTALEDAMRHADPPESAETGSEIGAHTPRED